MAPKPFLSAILDSSWKALAGQRADTPEQRASHRGAEIFSNSYFCNISEIKAKRVKIPIKTKLTSLVSRESVFAWRRVLGLLRRP